MERPPPSLHARGRVAGFELTSFPRIDVQGHDARQRNVAERGQQVLLDVSPVVLQGRGRQVLRYVPTIGVLTEGDAAEGWVAPLAGPDLCFRIVGGCFCASSRAEPGRGTVVSDNSAVPARGDLVSGAPIIASLLGVSHIACPSL